MIQNDCVLYPKSFQKCLMGYGIVRILLTSALFYGTNLFPPKWRFLDFQLHFDKIIVLVVNNDKVSVFLMLEGNYIDFMLFFRKKTSDYGYNH